MDDAAGQFLELIHGLEEVSAEVTPPGVSAWAGSLWRMLSEELAGPASPDRDGERDEVGGSG